MALRPAELSVTEIERLVRDPYAVYARRVLRLRPLDPLRQEPDAPLRGSVIHTVFERFLHEGVDPAAPDAAARLVAIAEAVFAAEVPWPAMRQLWLTRIAGLAPWFVAGEAGRRARGAPLTPETWGSFAVPGTAVTVRGKADRIDRLDDGRLSVLDYKTGTPPAPKQIRLFDRQLLIEAAMAEAGAFEGIAAATVAEIAHIGLGARPAEQVLALRETLKDDLVFDPDAALLDLQKLLTAYADPHQGYAARRQMERMAYDYGYDHLARFGEWDASAGPVREVFE